MVLFQDILIYMVNNVNTQSDHPFLQNNDQSLFPFKIQVQLMVKTCQKFGYNALVPKKCYTSDL